MLLNKLLPSVLLAWLPAASALPQRMPDGDWRSRLASAISQAIASNPELAAMESRVEAARHRALQSDVLPDPEVEFGIKDFPVSHPSLSRDEFTMEMVTARQRLPGRGKRLAQRRSAETAAESAAALHEVHEVAVAADVADAFFGLAELDRRLQILEQSRERLKRTAASAIERYRVGKGAQSDVLRANLETTALEDRLVSVKSERRARAARFNSLQNLPPESPVPPVGPLDPPPDPGTPGDIARRAEESSPAIAAARAAVRQAQEQRKLADLERRPDWTASAYYGRRERFEDMAGAFVSFNLPFTHPRRLEARRAEAEAELSSARADLEVARNQLRRDVAEAASELERNVDQTRLYRTSILPQAEMNFRGAQEAYAVGQIDFETFVRAALDVDNYEGELAMRVSGIGRALAALQKASGIPLIDGTPKLGESHARN